jgi:hypothetical protein
MPHKNENKKPTRMTSHTPTPTPAYSPTQQSTLWDSVKAGFGMSMGSRMFGFIFGDPTVRVEHKNLPPPPTSVYKEQNNCDTLREQIKFYKCDNQNDNDRCDDLYRQFYKCQKGV